MIVISDTKFSQKPARIMSQMAILPEPNTIPFGGVDMGSMKAQLAANVAGKANKIGFAFIPTAMEHMIGIMTCTSAMLLITSVR